MKCAKCQKEIKKGDKYYTRIGIIQCEECNKKSNGTISLDFILDKIIKEQSNKE